MLSESQVAQFHRDGFVKGSKVLTDAEVEMLRAETLRVINDKEKADVKQPVMCHNMGKADAPVWQIVNIWMASEAFAQLIRNRTVAGELSQLQPDATALRLWHDQIQYKPAGQGGVNMWHQDSPYWAVLTPKDKQITAWVALDDVDEENGCMSMVPGSHRWGNTIEFLHTLKQFDDMKAVKEFKGNPVAVRTCPVRKGEVHFHHSLTWHGSNANRSSRPRRAIALHFMTQDTRYAANGGHVMKLYIKVADGQLMEGDAFPLVWERSAVSR
jgi:ectoine hydroxylase-related dioxygenase (phytanoyl-CoA dioxygenase family)